MEKAGNDLLQTMNLGPERDILKYKLADMSRRIDTVKNKSSERKELLDQLAPLVQRYQTAVEGFSGFLDDSEEKLNALSTTPIDEETVPKLKSEIKVKR